MVHPFTRFNIAGVIWYQGESDAKIANSYYRSFPMLIQSWREKWQKYLPFYFVQIAPYKYADDTTHIHAAIVRDAQLQTMKSVPNTGMVVINDIGEVNNIHPKNKQEVGRRLARWAFAKNYGFKNLVYSGPGYKSAEIDKNKIIIHFDFADGGLIKKGKTLTEFQIAGADKKFYPAKAIIVGNMVEVSNSKIENPVAVRFAFSNAALPNLFNRVGLPASAFRTDNWETAEDAKLLF
jgi:sialate O-acetylesterase